LVISGKKTLSDVLGDVAGGLELVAQVEEKGECEDGGDGGDGVLVAGVEGL
jgi:hypothetical protein